MSDRDARTDELVRTALKIPRSERERFLSESTAGDTRLYEEVKTRLTTADETVIAGHGYDPDITQDAPLQGVMRIGNAVVTRIIDQGGMGIVYAATQVEEGFHRPVAIKVVKPGLVTKEVLHRFKMERQVLANLEHPNIARLYDAGTTDEGAPFLLMEFVEGVSIDRYCDQNDLTTEERLRLFLQVCDALQYAHQHLIVHRDIKPSNILVTQDGVPKLLDFGIAKLLDSEGRPSEKLSVTHPDARPMTPMYASPEQVRGDAVTTSSDIYSAGILLYQLLTGSLPYKFNAGTASAIERTICDTAPTRPSEAELQRESAAESGDKIRRKLRGDIDMILLMALRKEPERRYHSVALFAQDIRHYLGGLPVIAHRDTVGYRVRKFVRRHTAGVAAAALAVLALIGSTIVSAYFAEVAQQEKTVAEHRFDETRALARFFVTDMDDSIRAGETAARRQLVAKGLEYLRRLGEEASGDVSLQREVIAGYIKMGDIQGNPFGPNLGDTRGARNSYQLALDTGNRFIDRRQSSSELRREMAIAKRRLADLDAVGGNTAQALKGYQDAIPSLDGLELADALIRMGFAYGQTGDFEHAYQAYERSLTIANEELSKHPGDMAAHKAFAIASERLGETYFNQGDYSKASDLLTTAIQIYEDLSSADPNRNEIRRRLWSSTALLGDVRVLEKKPAEAEKQFRKGLDILDQLMAEDPVNRQYQRDAVATLVRLSNLLVGQPNRRAEARRMTVRALDLLRPLVKSPDVTDFDVQLYAYMLVAAPFEDLRNPAEALPHAQRSAEKTGEKNPQVLDILAQAYYGVGDKAKAIEVERKALALVPRVGGSQQNSLRRELEATLARFQGGKR